jgi:hypothetical protein
MTDFGALFSRSTIADVNKDGQVKAADALNILKMAAKFSTAPEMKWLFLPRSASSESIQTPTSPVIEPGKRFSQMLFHNLIIR